VTSAVQARSNQEQPEEHPAQQPEEQPAEQPEEQPDQQPDQQPEVQPEVLLGEEACSESRELANCEGRPNHPRDSENVTWYEWTGLIWAWILININSLIAVYVDNNQY